MVLSLLIEDFDGELDFVGLVVGVLVDEALDVAVHERGAGLGLVLEVLFFLVFGAPFDGVFVLVGAEVGEIEDVGSLELEVVVVDGELTAVETFGGKDSDGFGFSSVGDFEDTSLDGFFLEAQGAQF